MGVNFKEEPCAGHHLGITTFGSVVSHALWGCPWLQWGLRPHLKGNHPPINRRGSTYIRGQHCPSFLYMSGSLLAFWNRRESNSWDAPGVSKGPKKCGHFGNKHISRPSNFQLKHGTLPAQIMDWENPFLLVGSLRIQVPKCIKLVSYSSSLSSNPERIGQAPSKLLVY